MAETFRAPRNEYTNKIQLYYPKLFPPQLYDIECKDSDGNVVFCSPTLRLLGDLYQRKDKAEQALLTLNELTTEIASATEDKTAAEAKIKKAEEEVDKLKAQAKKGSVAKKKKLQKQISNTRNG